MIQYIDKDEALKELTSLKGKVDDGSSYANGWTHALRMMEIFINNNSKILPNTTWHLQEKDNIYKTLLIKDLCARLPYGVIVDIKYNKEHGSSDRLRICSEGSLILNTDLIGLCIEEEIYLKPYLRPMSSMSEKEILDLYKIAYNTWYSDSLYYKNEEWITFRDSIQNNALCFKSSIWLSDINKVINWLNAHHFDFCGLIEKGLALEAPKGMYKTE